MLCLGTASSRLLSCHYLESVRSTREQNSLQASKCELTSDIWLAVVLLLKWLCLPLPGGPFSRDKDNATLKSKHDMCKLVAVIGYYVKQHVFICRGASMHSWVIVLNRPVSLLDRIPNYYKVPDWCWKTIVYSKKDIDYLVLNDFCEITQRQAFNSHNFICH